jgi:outer membrane receptor protein involved in Fe transport
MTTTNRPPIALVRRLALALTVLASTHLHGQAPTPPTKEQLAKYDTNKNGVLDPTEIAAMQKEEDTGTITLTPFEVNTNKDVGYAAGNTLSGGRVDTPLELTPGSISVMTKEFMDDFNITNINDAGAWTLGFDMGSPVPTSQVNTIATYQNMFRGAPSTDNFPTRNGSINFGVADSYNTERFEFQRGPDTSMFGDGGPGGRQNSSSKRARFNSTQTGMTAQVDSYGGYRATLDYSKGWDRFGLRLNSLYQNNRGVVDNSDRIKKAWTLNAVTKLGKNTQFVAEYERVGEWNQLWTATLGDQAFMWDGVTIKEDAAPQTAATAAQTAAGLQLVTSNDYFVWNFGTGTFENLKGTLQTRLYTGNNGVFRIPWPGNPNLPAARQPYLSGYPSSFNLHAKSNVVDRNNDTLTAAIEHRAGNLFLKFNFDQNHYDTITPYSNTSPNNRILDVNKLMPDGRPNPMFLRYYVDVGQNRNYNEDRKREFSGLATYRFFKPNFFDYKQQLSLNTGYREQHSEQMGDAWRRTDNPANLDPSAGVNGVSYRIYWGQPRPDVAPIFTDPSKYFSGKWSVFQTGGSITERTIKYAGLTSQSAFLNERIAITASYRRDEVDVDFQNRVGFDPVTYRNVLGAPVNGVNTVGAHFKRTESVSALSYGFVAYPFRGGGEAANGFLKRAISPLGFVFNYAENTSPPGASAANPLIDGTPAPLTHSKTMDFGLRYSIPGGKAYVTVLHYNTDQEDIGSNFGSVNDIRNIWTNLGYNENDLIGPSSFQYTDPSARKLEGWEVELTANPTRNITLTANYTHGLTYIQSESNARKAYVAAHLAEWKAGAEATTGTTLNGHKILDPLIIKSAITNIENSLTSLTTGTLEDGQAGNSGNAANFRHRIKFAGAYGFTEGRLKGLRVNYGFVYNTHAKSGSRDARLKFGLPDSATPTAQQNAEAAFDYLWAPPNLLQTAGASYTRRFGKYQTRFQLNITNLTNNQRPVWGRNGASGAYSVIPGNALLNGNPRMQIMNNFTQFDPRKFTFTTTVSF